MEVKGFSFLSGRQKKVLKIICQSYLKGFGPVASGYLSKRFFKEASSTLRGELLSLEKKGFLKKLHTSSGRIPTDFGLRYYLENLAKKKKCPLRIKVVIRRNIKSEEDFFRREVFEKIVAEIAENISEVVLAAFLGKKERILIKEGMLKVLKRDEEVKDLEELIESLRALVEKFVEIFERKEVWPRIFIGEEVPFIRSGILGMVGGCYQDSKNKSRKILMALVGKRKMAYLRNLAILEEIKKTISSL